MRNHVITSADFQVFLMCMIFSYFIKNDCKSNYQEFTWVQSMQTGKHCSSADKLIMLW